MNERTIYLAALDIAAPAERSTYLDRACAGNAKLRQQVDALLAADARSGEFLNVPALRQMADNLDETQTFREKTDKEEFDLTYLTPSTKPGSLGTLGHYEVMQVLGQGGFGTVLKAFDEKLHRMVALKVLSRQLAATSPPRKRFLREARAVAAIKHENVVQVHSVEEQALPYIVMEFVDGSTLQDKMDEAGPLGVPEVLHIGRQIAAGLAAAHSLGLIHRDIKPGNILLEKGVVQKVKITDFGLARTADDASLTQSGTITGTPLYMAPEQAKATKLDLRADLFSLGSVLYALACGHPPFRAATTLAVLTRVANDTPRPLQEIIPETPDWFVAIIDKLLAKEPADRFQTAQEVADLLGLCESKLHAGLSPTAVSLGLKPASLEPVAKAEPKRKKFPVAAVAAGVVLMFSVMAAGVYFLIKNKSDGNVAGLPTKPTDPPAEAVPATFKNSIGMEFVKVPKGTGWLGGGVVDGEKGSGKAGKPGETKVIIENDFYLGQYEVTQEEWEKVMGLNPSFFSRKGGGNGAVNELPDADLKRFPVENVSRDDCQVFIERLNKSEKVSGWVYRLPKEVEWEYACRGGPVDKSESAFNFYFAKPMNTLSPEQANIGHAKGFNRTCKVGSYEPNRLGLYDMHGNIHEWCDDTIKGPDGASHDVARGGHWSPQSGVCEAIARSTGPSVRDKTLGLRLARVPVGPAVVVPATPTNSVRNLAEQVFKRGGTLTVEIPNVGFRVVKTLDQLPEGNFTFNRIDFSGDKAKELGDALFNGLDLTPGAKTIVVQSPTLTDAGLAKLTNAPGIAQTEEFSLSRCPLVTDAGTAQLSKLERLTSITMIEMPISGTGFAGLKANVTALTLLECPLTPDGVVVISRLPGLRTINFHRTPLTLKHFQELSKAKLVDVNLAETGLTDEGLQSIARISGLKKLGIWNNRLTEKSLADLKSMKDLEYLNVCGHKAFKDSDIKELVKALPKCRIDSDFGTFNPTATSNPRILRPDPLPQSGRPAE